MREPLRCLSAIGVGVEMSYLSAASGGVNGVAAEGAGLITGASATALAGLPHRLVGVDTISACEFVSNGVSLSDTWP